MTLRLITPATALPVSLDDAKLNLKIDGTDSDAIVDAWIRGIAAHAEHWMERSILRQGWRVTLDRFPDAIRLSRPPIVSVESVKFLDPTGAEQTLDPADYLVDDFSEPGYLVPAPGKAWPDTAERINAVWVDYTAGYGDSATDVPAGIRLYLLAKLTEQFDPNAKLTETVQTTFTERLLDPYRIYPV